VLPAFSCDECGVPWEDTDGLHLAEFDDGPDVTAGAVLCWACIERLGAEVVED
jgi:hypothetical protein